MTTKLIQSFLELSCKNQELSFKLQKISQQKVINIQEIASLGLEYEYKFSNDELNIIREIISDFDNLTQEQLSGVSGGKKPLITSTYMQHVEADSMTRRLLKVREGYGKIDRKLVAAAKEHLKAIRRMNIFDDQRQ